ncbi:unnamed protein product [Larinioides sclopetarius]|uniref:Uncharacterized protein n=1 Tax=Larinioides sclopetarius TaxID=280406 RepID=A0AAV1YTP5_9ARAC
MKSLENESKLPTKEVKSPDRDSKSPMIEVKSLGRESYSPVTGTTSPEKESKSQVRQAKSPEKERKSPKREIVTLEKESKSPTREVKSPEKESKLPVRDAESPEKESKSPIREVEFPDKGSESLSREDKLPGGEIGLPEKERKLSDREIRIAEKQRKSPTKSPERGIKLPAKDNKSVTETQFPVKEMKFPRRDDKSPTKQDRTPSIEVKAPTKETKTPAKGMKTPEREIKSPTRETKLSKNSPLISSESPSGDTKLSHGRNKPSVRYSPSETKEPFRESPSPTRKSNLDFKSPVLETEVQSREAKEIPREIQLFATDICFPGEDGKSPLEGIERGTKIIETEVKSPLKVTVVPATKTKPKGTTKETKTIRKDTELGETVESSIKGTKSRTPEHMSTKQTIIVDENIKSTALEEKTTEKKSTSFSKESDQTLERISENVTDTSLLHERIPLTNVSEKFHYSSKNSISMTLFSSQSIPETTERIIKLDKSSGSKESENLSGLTEFDEQKYHVSHSDFNFKEYYTEFTEEIVSSLPCFSVGEALAAGVVETDSCSIVINNKKMLLQEAIEENLISSDTNLSIISKNEVTLSDDQQIKMPVELNSAAVEENYKICEENTSKLEAWMKDIEDKLADLGVIEEHLPGLQLQISTVKVLKEELESKQNLITTCLDQMRQLAQRGLEVLTKEEINYLQKNLISLRRHYDSLVNECDRLLKRLTSAFEELQKYKSEVKSLKEWLNTAQRQFSVIQSSMGALNKLESKYEHIRSFTSDVIAHQADLRFITMAAQKFIAESQDYLKALNTLRVNLPDKLSAIKASESEIKSEVQEVTNVFRNFLNEVTRLSDNYAVICSKYRSYVEVAEKAKIWISDVKKSSRKVIEEPVADEPSAVQDQLDKIKLINMEVVGQGRIVENVYQAVKVLTDTAENCNIAPVEAKDIENTLNKLQEDYAELITSIASRIKELQIALIHSQDIQGGLDRILKWLEETETAMKLHNKPVSLIIEKLEAQVQEYKILKSDIENQKQSIDMLASSAKEISSDANPKLLKKVDTKLKDISQRFDKLCEKISKRWALLEEVSENVHAFQEMSLRLDEFFSATLERIESIDNAHRTDVDGFSSIIEYTLNQRNSKKDDFEQLLKVGKMLAEKKDVSDTSLVKDKIKSLEEQWKNIGDLLNEKKQMGKARSEQLATYDTLRVKILDWLLKMERDFEKLEPVALDQIVLKKQATETQHLLKEHTDYSSPVEKINDLGVSCESVMKLDSSKGKSSPVKKAPSPTRKSPSKSKSNENFSVSPVKNQVTTQSPLSTVSSGFSSRRSSTDNIGVFDDITPIQQQLSEINDRYNSLGVKISERNQEICTVTEEMNSFYTVIKELTIFTEGKQKRLPKENVLLAKGGIDNHIYDLKEMQREVLEKQPDMDNLKMNILCSLSKRKAAKATDLQEELHNIEKKWNLLSISIKQILTFLQDLKEFQDSQQLMQNWLAQKEKMFQVLGPIASEPRMVTSQVQQVQVMRDEFTSQNYLIDRLSELSKTIILHLQNTGSSSAKISEQMDKIQQQWNAMSGRLIDREKSLEAASGIVKDFHKNLSELQGKVQNVSDKFDALEEKEMTLEILLKKLSELEEELDKQRPLLADAQSVCEQLCDVLTDSASKTEIKYKISLIEKSYGNLKKKIDNKKAEVESSLKEDKVFFKVCEEISSWLKTTETSFSHSGPISADLSKLLKEKENYESLYKEIMNKEHEVYLCLSKGSDMINKLSGKQESSLKAKLDSIKKQFEKIKKNSIDRHTSLRSCYENCKKYQSAVDIFIPWLQDIEERFNSLKLSNLRRETLNKQLKETQALKSELSVHFQEYQNIQQVGEDILSSCETDKETTKKQLINLKKKWTDLNSDVSAKVLFLEDLFQTILEFEENLRDIQHGVQRLEDKMCSHDALGDVSCDPVLLECLKILLEEAVGMKNEISKLKKFAKGVIQKAGEGTDTTEILKSVDDIEKRYTTVTKNLETRCATLSASHKIITVFMEQVKSLRTELSNLDEAFDNLRPIARDLASLKNQLKDLKDIRSNLCQTKKKYTSSEKIYDDISKQEHISETKSYLEQINNLSKKITRLEEHINERETTIITMTTRIENFYSMYLETEKVIKSLLKKEEGFEASVGDVETIRKHQQKFKKFQSSEVLPLSKQIIEVNKIGQGLIQSATSGVDTTDLEQKLEILNNSWNSLQESINEKEKKLDIALLQSGKFQEALSGVQKWLIDTEEMVSNQKAPSPDFKVCKAQVQEQKFLKKMLLDRQNSVMSLKAIRTEIVSNTKTSELEQAETLMENISHRFDELISTAEERMTVLEKIIPLAQEFQNVSTPLVEWLESCEKKLFSMSSVPVEEKKIKAMVAEHEKVSNDIRHHKKPIEQLNAIYEKLKTITTTSESDSLCQKIHTINEKFNEIIHSSESVGSLLKDAQKGIGQFSTTYTKVITFIEETTVQLTHFQVLSVYSDKLQNQLKELKKLKEKLDTEESNVQRVITSGEEIMKVASGEDSIQMKEKLDSLNIKVSEISNKIKDRLRTAEESLPLVETFYTAINKLSTWLDSLETSLKLLDSSTLDVQRESIKKLEESIPEYRSILETINNTGPRLCQLAAGEGSVVIENQMSRANQRFEKASEQIQRKAERIQLTLQRKYDVISDIDELSEWFQETEKRVTEDEGLSSEPNVLTVLLKEQKSICEELNAQKNRVRDVITTAKKLMRESSSEDLSYFHEKMEALKTYSNNVSIVCQERLSALEQALPLAQHFFETHSDLGQWLDEVEGEAELLEAPALNSVQIKKQQDRNKDLTQSVQEHKPLVEKLNKTGSALTKLCKEDESSKLEVILESDNSRYNALRKILREHQNALEEALQATSQFSDKLEGILNALTSTADQLHNAEPISAHPDRIQEQINDNKAVLQDLDKRTITLEAVKKAADDVIGKASTIDEPAVRDIKMKLDRLNDLWVTIQTAAHNRGKSLEEALVAAEKFWDELTAVMKALKELQSNLNCQEPPAVEPAAVQQQQDVLQEIKQEITQTKPEVDHCRQAGQNLMQLCGEPDKPDVKKHIEDLDSVWENVTTLYAKREQNLVDAMEKAMVFHNTMQNLLEFLDTFEEKFSKFGAVSSDIDAVKTQINELKNFKSQVDPHMVEVEALNRQAQELMERTSSDQAISIREPLIDINKRWDDLLKSIVERQREMENTLLKLGQFQHALEEHLIWMTKTEKTLDELKPVFGDPQVIEVVLAKHKVISNDIQAHQSSIDAINRAGHEFVDSDRGSEDAKSTHSKLQNLQIRWQHLQDKSAERYRELEEALKEAQQFHQDIQDLLMWLNDIDGQLVTSKPVGGLPETAREQLNKFMDLYNELDTNRYKVENIMQQGQNYLKKSGESNTKTLQHSLRTLKQRSDSVLNKANDRKIKLEIALREATEFHEALQQFVEWLTNAEKYLTGLKPVSRHMKAVLEQIEEHRNFQKDLSAHREVMLNLDKKGTHLKYFSQKQDVILIKNLLISVQHRWEKVVSKAAERTRALDHGYKEAKEFHDAWTSLSAWLDEAEKILDTTTPIGNDPLKIKKLLSKHKEFQRSLGSKQITYDATMKIGRILKDKCPKQDVQLIQDMIDELKVRWNKVCSKSVDKQRKLEEALLYSGQFKDAVLALMDWFDKAITSLSETKPYHGDLDTVTSLIEQHKSFEEELKNRGLSLESVCKTSVDLKKQASAADVESISTQVDELKAKWKTVSDLSEKKKRNLSQALQLAEKLYKMVHILLEWLSDAEMKLRFFGSLPEDEESTRKQIADHENFLSEMRDKENTKNDTLTLAQDILEKCHPDGISVIRHWITIIQSRWDEISAWAKQRDQRLRDHLLSLRDINSLLEELLAWLIKAESSLTELEAQPLPDDLPTLDELIKEHQVFMTDMSKKQTDVEKISKAFSSKRHQAKTLVPPSQLKEKSKDKSSRSGTPTPLKASTPLRPQIDSDIKHPRARLLLEKWRIVWLLAMERQRRLQDRRNYLLELDRIKHFDFNDWRSRYLGWLNNKKSRIMDQFKKIDKNNHGKVTKQDFIDGILKSKFATSRLEMERVADIFDRNGDGFIDTKEYIETLRPEREDRPKTEAEKIQDEVQRLVSKCTCVHRFKVYQVGEGKYRFGDSQKLRLVRILRSTVMVRVGGGWVALDEFLVKNDPCRAKGRTNLELREQFILADGVSQSMAPFKPKPSPNSSVSSQSGTTNSMPSAGPITKIREKSERSTPMRQSRSSAENSSDISGPSFSETDSFSNRSGFSRTTPSRLSPRTASGKPSSRPSSRQGSRPPSRAPSDLSQDGVEDYKTNRKTITGNGIAQKVPVLGKAKSASESSKIPSVQKSIKQPLNRDTSRKIESRKE